MAKSSKIIRKGQVVVVASSPKDESFLMSLRNNEAFLKRSFKNWPVTKVEHHRWFKNFLSCSYSYTIYCDSVRVGHIRFEKKKTGIFSIGIALLPRYQGHGIADKALRFALVDLKQKERKAEIVAEVRSDNYPAQKFFLRSGFNLEFFTYKYYL